ncbi:hypothetical protein EMIT0P43_30127 [Pseudomonas jessenii]
MPVTMSGEHAKGNMYGFGAILLWSAMPPLIRLVSEDIGPLIGAALMFSAASVLMILLNGWNAAKEIPLFVSNCGWNPVCQL